MSANSPDLVTPSGGSGAGVALLDLERELTCSICTDILYQPLTCLDCLHTFCGACLTEWFKWQHARAESTARRSTRRGGLRVEYTCPSCRANVRETRPNATVTTLLDMWTAANPGRGKSSAEKAENAKIYTPGKTKVFPSATIGESGRRNESASETEDQILLREVRELSLRDIQGNGGSAHRHGHGEGVRRREGDRSLNVPGGASARTERPRSNEHSRSSRDTSRSRSDAPARQIEHQSSLRSLLSASDIDSNEMQEEILRQITEEGLLDGIDLDNLQVEQEDEISERIAQAYRRRQREIHSGRQRARSAQPPAHQQNETSTGRENLHDSQEQGRPRSSSNNSPRHSHNDTRRARNNSGPVESLVTESASRSSPAIVATGGEQSNVSSREQRRDYTSRSGMRITEQWRRGAAGINPQPPAMSILEDDPNSTSNSRTSNTTHTASSETPSTTAPTVSCKSCRRKHIEYELHYHCPRCSTGSDPFDLCRRCYIEGKGCRHWYGFGYAAWQRYERQAPKGGYPPSVDAPHVFESHRYTKSPGSGVTLETGVFCELCQSNANECYWQCGYCNDGVWGYCNACVSKARHCTHMLLSLACSEKSSQQPAPQPGLSALLAPSIPTDSLTLTPIQNLTSCNVCGFIIPDSDSYFHCPLCNDGNYDVCNQCYQGLASSGRISALDGPRGWRRCLSGHRMLVIGFVPDDQAPFLRRAVLEPVVGGWSGSVDSRPRPSSPTADAQPRVLPNAGYGTRAVALWTRVPDDGEASADELSFPRNAELVEVEDINGDWSCGVYCGRRGLFPGPYARVTMP